MTFAGRNYRVKVYGQRSKSDGMGGRLGVYDDLIFSTRAKIQQIEPNKRFQYGALVDKQLYEMRLRHRSEIKNYHTIEIVKTGQRLKVHSIVNDKLNDRFLKVIAYDG